MLYLGFDGTWRWRYLDNAVPYERFWSNVVDFLASFRPMKKRLIITSSAQTVPVGSRMEISAKVYDESWKLLTADGYTIQMVNTQTHLAQPIRLAPDGRKDGLFKLTVPMAEPGEYELAAADGTPADNVAGKFVTVTLPQEEFEARRPTRGR